MGSKREVENWLDAFLEWTSESESPSMFRLWSGIAALSAALERKCYISWGSLTFYPNMYIVLVGPSGCRKGTAMGPAGRLLRKIPGINISADATTREALIRRIKESVNTAIHSDGTMSFHSSMTIFSEEFTVFLGYDSRDLMANLCDWYDCKDVWTYDTKHQGRDEITGLWVTMIGATTPFLIRTTLPPDSIGGGLTSRIIFVYEERKEKTSVYPYEDPALGRKLLNDLEKIHLTKGQFRVTDGFANYWTEWYTEQSNNPKQMGEEFDGYIDRRPTHIMKLSMLMAVARADNPDNIVAEQDIKKAIAILEATEQKMPMVFKGFGRSNISDLMEKAMTLIDDRGQIELSEIMNIMYRDADRFTMGRILDTLETMRRIKLTHAGGRSYITSLCKNIEQSESPQTVSNSTEENEDGH